MMLWLSIGIEGKIMHRREKTKIRWMRRCTYYEDRVGRQEDTSGDGAYNW